MPLFIALYIINCGIMCLVRGQILQESTMFVSGNVIFTWTSSNYSSYAALLSTDLSHDFNWTRVNGTQYTVKNAMLFDFIRIYVYTTGSASYNVMSYNVSKVRTQIGGRTNISWTTSFFPSAGQYHVYHTNKDNRNLNVFSISSSGVSYGGDTSSTKYTYLTRPFDSTNIAFEIRDITLDDAGYYNGGILADAAWSGGGVVLIVSAKPEKPEIKGNLTTLVDSYLELTCISKSTSAPDYYSKLLTLSYTWFVNNNEIRGEIKETLRLKVTRGHKYNRYSCTATEGGLESDRSDTVHINILYGEEQSNFTANPKLDKNYKFTVKEGDVDGPIFCSAECNPPCNVTWKYKESNGLIDALSKNGILLLQSVNMSIVNITCLSRWKNESMKKDISLDFQFSKIKTQIGGRTNMTWKAAFFPSAGQYHVYHTYKEKKTLFSISSSGVSYGGDTESTKYTYITRPFDSTNIAFESRDITLDDAGYYNGGTLTDAAWSGGVVVLIVFAKPEKPEINGNLTSLVDTYLELTCISRSTSAPDYYSKLLILSYTWFVNDTKVDEKNRGTLRLKVTRGHKYNRYSCTATEEDLESDRSDAIQINPLYGPEQLTFTPNPKLDNNDKFTVMEGDDVGPIFCSADSNPPSNFTWKYKESNRDRDNLSQNGILLLQSVNRNVTQITCSSRWKSESVEKDITLDVQYIDEPIIYVNDEWVSYRIAVDIQERKLLRLSCFVDGNPTPIVRLGKSQNRKTAILSVSMDHWSNYSFSTGAKCSDTGTYVCYGQSQSTNLKTNKSIGVNILCEPRLDKEVQLQTFTESGRARILIIPVIAYPSPDLSLMVWLGPNNLPTNMTANAVIQSNDIIYKHRVITIISGLEEEHYGEYKLLYDRTFLTSVIITKEEYAGSSANIVNVALPSTLLGITWLLLIIYVVFQKWRRNLQTTDQNGEKINQLETQSMEQHYDDLQDIDVEKNYSNLDRSDQETPYEETL